MRITKDSIEKIRSSINLSDIVSMYIKIQKVGSRFRALCPFHNEKTPSFYIDDNKGLFHCFGCQASGDVFSFVQKIDNCSFYEAVLKVAELAKIPVEYEKESFDDEKQELIKKIFSETTFYYHNNLKYSKQAIEYLRNRRINDSIIEKYKIGWASRNDYQFFQKLNKKYNLNPEILFQLGLLAKNNDRIYPFFYDRLIIPIQNHYQEYVAFGARTLNDDVKPKYINSPEHQLFKKGTLLFNFSNARLDKENEKIIVVEGYFDLLSLVQIGIPYVVAPLGTALTEYHLQILGRKFSHLFLLFDMDQAGQKATLSSIELAVKYFSDIKIIKLPTNVKDIDQFIREKDVDKEFFERYLDENSISGLDTLIRNKLYLNYKGRDINKAYKDFFVFLNSLKDDIIPSILIKRAAYLDGVFSEYQILNMYLSKKDFKDIQNIKIINSQHSDGVYKLEMEFVAFIINSEDFINIARQYIKPDSFYSKKASEFYQKALISLNYNDRQAFLRNELSEDELNFMYSNNLKEFKNRQSIFEDYLSFFKLRELENQLDQLNIKIKEAEDRKKELHEYLEKKQFLISSIQKLKEYRKKIYKNEENE